MPQSLTPYTDWLKASSPPWLQGPLGRGWHEAFGLLWDITADAARQGVLARFIDRAPSDALAYLSSERVLEPMRDESEASWRARIRAAWDAWVWAGTKKGVLDAVKLTGLANVNLYTYWDWQDGDAEAWARFWIVVGKPHPWAGPKKIGGGWKVGDGTVVGVTSSTFPLHGVLFPSDPNVLDSMNRLKRLVRTWKPSHAKCVEIRLMLSGHLVGDGWKVGDGTTVGGNYISIPVPQE